MRAVDPDGTVRSAAHAFRRILTVAPAFLFAVDAAGIVTVAEGEPFSMPDADSRNLVGQSALVCWRNCEVFPDLLRALAGEEFHSRVSVPGPRHYDVWYLPVRGEEGALTGAVGLAIEVTRQRETEHELREKLSLIRHQTATIRALATPIIKVWDGVLCLPVIGTVDSERATEMMQTLLREIVKQQARFAVVDVTGVDFVDTNTANMLIKLFQAARMLGVEGLLSGMRPAVAQTIIELGVELSEMRTTATLEDALLYCIRSGPNREALARAQAPRGLVKTQ